MSKKDVEVVKPYLLEISHSGGLLGTNEDFEVNNKIYILENDDVIEIALITKEVVGDLFYYGFKKTGVTFGKKVTVEVEKPKEVAKPKKAEKVVKKEEPIVEEVVVAEPKEEEPKKEVKVEVYEEDLFNAEEKK